MKKNLTEYDVYPENMLIYLRNYGPHFNRKLYEFAVKKMTKMVDNKEVSIVPQSKEQVEKILKDNNVRVVNDVLYDGCYVYCMGLADFIGSSIPDERHLAYYVRDVIDDFDAPDGLLFNRFIADAAFKGIPIDWEEFL